MSDLDVISDVRYLCGMLGSAILADYLGVSSFIVDVWRQGTAPWPEQAEAVQCLAREHHRRSVGKEGIYYATTSLSAEALRRAEERLPRPDRCSQVLIDTRQQLHALFDAFVAYRWLLEANGSGSTPLELLDRGRLYELKSELVDFLSAHAKQGGEHGVARVSFG